MNDINIDTAIVADFPEFASSTLQIEGISEPVILRYFQTMNAGEFDLTAALFAQDGVMHPPVEDKIVGREAIAKYLHKEAQDLKADPRLGVIGNTEAGNSRFQVSGKVETSLFGVNVLWVFILNEQGKILSVQIKLLASLKELLSLKP